MSVGGGGLPPGLIHPSKGGGWRFHLPLFLCELRDLAGFEAVSTDSNPLGSPFDEGSSRDQVRQPPPLRHIMGMADPVAHRRAFPANVTPLGHPGTPLEASEAVGDGYLL